jgi:AraC-like DNA-binding protein
MIIQLAEEMGYILHEKANQYYGEGVGFLSIKSFFNGQAHYTSEGRHYAANDSSYLILNHAQPYTVEIESLEPVESFCVFFAPQLTQMVYQSLHESVEQALASPVNKNSGSLSFFDRTYSHDNLLSPTLQKLRQVSTVRMPEQGWLVEKFHDLLYLLLKVHTRTIEEMNLLSATRFATRAELYRRLHYAKDYADAFFTSQITINDMAEIAGLSPNHLLRMFRQVFHQSPYQYLLRRRLEHAQNLLRRTNRSVTEICMEVGFESLGSFSWWFHRRTGLSPLNYRLQNR